MEAPGEEVGTLRDVEVRNLGELGNHFMGLSRGEPAAAEPIQEIVGPVQGAHAPAARDHQHPAPVDLGGLDAVPFRTEADQPLCVHTEAGCHEPAGGVGRRAANQDQIARGDRAVVDDLKIAVAAGHLAQQAPQLHRGEAFGTHGVVGAVGVEPIHLGLGTACGLGRRIRPEVYDDLGITACPRGRVQKNQQGRR